MTKLNITDITATDREVLFTYEYLKHRFQRGITFSSPIRAEFLKDPVFMKLVNYVVLSDCIYTFGLDYYDKIELPFKITEHEKNFFEDAYYYGLAEFRYKNNIELTKKTKLIAPIRQNDTIRPPKAKKQKALVLNGGGKDGAVAIEIAKNLSIELAWFTSGAAASRNRIAEASGVTNFYLVDRKTDGYVKNNKKYSGHKPMSLYVAMVSALTAYLNGYYYVIAANEYSANFPNLFVGDFPINHQYTKSFQFEKDLKALFEAAAVPIHYFSITRQLYELQVMKIFSDFTQYHDTFLSCNQGMADDIWCLSCAKCAFVIGALYLFNPEAADRRWGDVKQFYKSNPTLIDETLELINPGARPFECIGTRGENLVLLNGLSNKIDFSENQMKTYKKYKNVVAESDELNLESISKQNNFPAELSDKIGHMIKGYFKS